MATVTKILSAGEITALQSGDLSVTSFPMVDTEYDNNVIEPEVEQNAGIQTPGQIMSYGTVADSSATAWPNPDVVSPAPDTLVTGDNVTYQRIGCSIHMSGKFEFTSDGRAGTYTFYRIFPDGLSSSFSSWGQMIVSNPSASDEIDPLPVFVSGNTQYIQFSITFSNVTKPANGLTVPVWWQATAYTADPCV